MHLSSSTGLRAFLDPARWVFLFAFALTLSIAAAEPLLFVALAVWAGTAPQDAWRRLRQSPFFAPALAFSLLAAASVLWSVHPGASASRLHRLLFVGMLFVIGDVFSRPDRRPWPVVASFCGGAALLAVYDVFRIPAAVSRGAVWADAGNMRDPQIFLVAICLLVSMLFVPSWARWRPMLFLGLLPVVAALVMHLKRGVWISLAFALLLLAALSRRWKVLVGLLLIAAAAFSLPQVRARASDTLLLFNADEGGRYLLWRYVTPRLIADYPQGMGWCAPTHEDLLAYSAKVQPRLRHLHNNVLQVTAELGWAGLLIWLGWMGVSVVTAWRVIRRWAPSEPAHWIALGLFCAFVGLMANGMVEYNFGDSEILMLYALLFGLVEALRRADNAPEGVLP